MVPSPVRCDHICGSKGKDNEWLHQELIFSNKEIRKSKQTLFISKHSDQIDPRIVVRSSLVIIAIFIEVRLTLDSQGVILNLVVILFRR